MDEKLGSAGGDRVEGTELGDSPGGGPWEPVFLAGVRALWVGRSLVQGPFESPLPVVYTSLY